MYKVVFDMGNVLLDYNPRRFLSPYVKNEEDLQSINNALFASPEWLGGDMGIYTFDEIEKIACAKLPERLHNAVKQAIKVFPTQMFAKDGIEELISKLIDKGYDLYILSNVGTSYSEMRSNIPYIESFKGEFLSHKVKLLKPDIKIYQMFFDEFQLSPEECFFIDDSAVNVFMAEQAGMKGIVYRDNPKEVLATILSL